MGVIKDTFRNFFTFGTYGAGQLMAQRSTNTQEYVRNEIERLGEQRETEAQWTDTENTVYYVVAVLVLVLVAYLLIKWLL